MWRNFLQATLISFFQAVSLPYKWMKWFVDIAKFIIKLKNYYWKFSCGSIPEYSLKIAADIAIIGEGEITAAEVVKKSFRNEAWADEYGIAYKKSMEK